MTTYDTVRCARVFPHWTRDGNAFWYGTVGSDRRLRYWWVDAVAGTRQPAVDTRRLFSALRAAHIAASENPLVADLDETTAGQLRVAVAGWWVTVDRQTYQLSDVRPLRSATPHPLPPVDADARPAPNPLATPARVIVDNRTGGPVRVELLEPDGTPVEEHGEASVTGTPVIAARSGGIAVVTDAAGHEMGRWRVSGDGGTAVVEPVAHAGPGHGRDDDVGHPAGDDADDGPQPTYSRPPTAGGRLSPETTIFGSAMPTTAGKSCR